MVTGETWTHVCTVGRNRRRWWSTCRCRRRWHRTPLAGSSRRQRHGRVITHLLVAPAPSTASTRPCQRRPVQPAPAPAPAALMTTIMTSRPPAMTSGGSLSHLCDDHVTAAPWRSLWLIVTISVNSGSPMNVTTFPLLVYGISYSHALTSPCFARTKKLTNSLRHFHSSSVL